MTLREFFLIALKYWWLVIGLPVVCALAVLLGYPMLAPGGSYTATTTIVSNTASTSLLGVAQDAARMQSAATPGASVSATNVINTNNVTVSAVSASSETAEEASRAAAERTIDVAKELFKEPTGSTSVYPFDAQLSDTSVSVTKASSKKFAIAAFLVGLFAALAVVVVIDLVRKPVISAREVKQAYGLPLLASSPSSADADRLVANIRFAAKDDGVKDVCIVPVGENGSAEAVAHVVNSADGMEAKACGSVAKGIDGVYEARDAQAVVLTVRQWTDSMKDADAAVDELRLAGANLVGFVFLPKA